MRDSWVDTLGQFFQILKFFIFDLLMAIFSFFGVFPSLFSIKYESACRWNQTTQRLEILRYRVFVGLLTSIYRHFQKFCKLLPVLSKITHWREAPALYGNASIDKFCAKRKIWSDEFLARSAKNSSKEKLQKCLKIATSRSKNSHKQVKYIF